jgi:hypothetical protein
MPCHAMPHIWLFCCEGRAPRHPLPSSHTHGGRSPACPPPGRQTVLPVLSMLRPRLRRARPDAGCIPLAPCLFEPPPPHGGRWEIWAAAGQPAAGAMRPPAQHGRGRTAPEPPPSGANPLTMRCTQPQLVRMHMGGCGAGLRGALTCHPWLFECVTHGVCVGRLCPRACASGACMCLCVASLPCNSILRAMAPHLKLLTCRSRALIHYNRGASPPPAAVVGSSLTPLGTPAPAPPHNEQAASLAADSWATSRCPKPSALSPVASAQELANLMPCRGRGRAAGAAVSTWGRSGVGGGGGGWAKRNPACAQDGGTGACQPTQGRHGQPCSAGCDLPKCHTR